MAENATKPAAAPGQEKAASADAGHVPITEEMDSAKWTLPPVAPVAIALVVLAAILGAYLWLGRPKPGAAATISKVAVAEQQGGNGVMVLLHLQLQNTHEKPLWIRGLKATLRTDQGEWTDVAASVVDHERYLAAFPDLRAHHIDPLRPETKIASGGEERGMLMVTFPVSKQAFDARKALTVTVDAYDRRPLVVSEAR
jgi:hypothetical protein